MSCRPGVYEILSMRRPRRFLDVNDYGDDKPAAGALQDPFTWLHNPGTFLASRAMLACRSGGGKFHAEWRMRQVHWGAVKNSQGRTPPWDVASDHMYPRMSPSTSVALPVRYTVSPEATIWSGPTATTGSWFASPSWVANACHGCAANAAPPGIVWPYSSPGGSVLAQSGWVADSPDIAIAAAIKIDVIGEVMHATPKCWQSGA